MQADVERLPQYDPAFAETRTDSPARIKKWNSEAGRFEPLAGPTVRGRLWDAMRRDQKVVAIAGTLSHFNVSPKASRIFVGQPGDGNLPPLFDPTRQDDLDRLKAGWHLGARNNYCSRQGCDYTMVIRFQDQSVQRVLLPVGYRRTDGTVNPAASDPLSAASFVRYVVNVAASAGPPVGVQLFRTPFGSDPAYQAIAAAELGGVSYPLVNEWSSVDAGGGGAGAAGPGIAPDLGTCAANARRYDGGPG